MTGQKASFFMPYPKMPPLIFKQENICKLGQGQCMTFADCRLQTGLTRKILLTVISSSTTFPVQNNINVIPNILLDFLWFTLLVLDSR